MAEPRSDVLMWAYWAAAQVLREYWNRELEKREGKVKVRLEVRKVF
jgi:hypothetical protein